MSKADGRLKFTGGKCAGLIEKKKGTYEVAFDEAACEVNPKPFSVTVDGETWDLWQMHVHGPSEHTVNGIYYPIEIHLVHLREGVATADGPTKALVLGVFLPTGKANSFFDVLTAQPSFLLIPSIPKSKRSGPALPTTHAHYPSYTHNSASCSNRIKTQTGHHEA